MVFLVFGVPFALFSYWMLSDATYTSIGLASTILGATALLVPSRAIPGESIKALVEAASVNVEALLEEFDAEGKAVYLAPRDDRVYCFVPLRESMVDGLRFERISVRVLSRVGGVDGLFVFPPGSEVVRLAGLGEENGVEDALVYLLVDYVELVESVRAVETGDRVVVELLRPRVDPEYTRYQMCLGSLASSVAGCVLAWIYDAPVVYIGEEKTDDRITASFRVNRTGQE